MTYDFDYFVIGGGSGGVRSARIAASHGAKVGLAEPAPLGGTCVNLGCIPKKLLSYAAHFRDEAADALAYGWTVGDSHHDWATLIANKDKEISRLNGIYQRLLEGPGVEILRDRAAFIDPHTLRVGDRVVTAKHILIATGGSADWPDEPGTREYGITSDQAFHLPEMPRRVIVCGGGYIAVEFASIFHGLGAQVTQLYRGKMFLRGFDGDLRETLAQDFAARGINLRFNTIIERLEKTSDSLVAHMTDGHALEADAVLFAVGRRPNVTGLQLAAAGVVLDPRGAVSVDARYQTSQPHIYAVGDVTDRVNLTPVALAEGHWVADMLFGGVDRPAPGYDNIPTAVFSNPTIATVGPSEESATARLGEDGVLIYRSAFRPLKATLTGNQERTVMKLVVERATDRVIGAHMIGPDAPEIIQGIAIAIEAGATKAVFDRTIGIHPSAAEEFVTMRTPQPRRTDSRD